MTLLHFLIFDLLLFLIGLYGVLIRKSAIQMYLSLEIMFNAVNVNFIAFSYFRPNSLNFSGHLFVLLVITIAAVEAAVALAIILALYRQTNEIEPDKIKLLKH